MDALRPARSALLINHPWALRLCWESLLLYLYAAATWPLPAVLASVRAVANLLIGFRTSAWKD